jgi:hypothetical protein
MTTDRVTPGQIWRARNEKPRFTVSCPRLLDTGERMVVHRPTDGGAADHPLAGGQQPRTRHYEPRLLVPRAPYLAGRDAVSRHSGYRGICASEITGSPVFIFT